MQVELVSKSGAVIKVPKSIAKAFIGKGFEIKKQKETKRKDS